MRAPKREGEEVRRRLDARELRDKNLRMKIRGTSLLIPLKPSVSRGEIEEKLMGVGYDLGKGRFEVAPTRRARNLAELLGDIEPSKLALLPRSYDIIGDIAVIELDPSLSQQATRIGEALLRLHSRLKSVYSKAGPVKGAHRLRELRRIAGEEKNETLHRENGCIFKLNIHTTFFNPRLGGERLRVAKQITPGETVLDMFAGVGPFSILIAKITDARVYAIDSNPEAVRYLKENLRMNQLEEKVEVMEGDAARLAEGLEQKMDRVVMNLPERASEYIGGACRALKSKGGIIHFYSFQKEPDPTEKAEELLSARVQEAHRSVRKILRSRAIREIAARTYQVVVDAEVV